jgi:hypothetical protein
MLRDMGHSEYIWSIFPVRNIVDYMKWIKTTEVMQASLAMQLDVTRHPRQSIAPILREELGCSER